MSETVTEESTTLNPQRAQGVANEIEKGRFDNFDKYSDEDKELIKKSVEVPAGLRMNTPKVCRNLISERLQ